MKTDFIEIFQTIRAQMQPYTVAGFKTKTNSDLAYHLSTDQQYHKIGIENNETYFFGVEVKNGYVSLYFNSNFTAKEIDLLFSPELSALLIAQDCLHITELDDKLLKSIINALNLGSKIFKQKGWV